MPIIRILPRGAAAVLIALASFLVVGLHAEPARAQSTPTCSENGAFNMNFGTVTPSGASTTGFLSVTCGPPFSGPSPTFFYAVCIYLNFGGQPVGTTRRMTNYNNGFLNYNFFADPAHTQLIGPQPAGPLLGPVAIQATGTTAATVLIPIYGWVYPGQTTVTPGTYFDNGVGGTMLFRSSTTGTPVTTNCTTGGSFGGQAPPIGSSAIQATFARACTVSATNIDFGSVPAPQAALRENGDIQVLCPASTPFRVGMDNGQNFDGSMRRMSGPRGYVRYQLYRDSANTHVWGNDATSMAVGTTDSSGNPALFTVYGQVPAQPNAAVGSYADTIVVTVYY